MSDFLAPPGITRAGLDAAATALQQDPDSDFRAAQNATILDKLNETLGAGPVAADSIVDWWIYPAATYVATPSPRTYFGGVSKTGKVTAGYFDHLLNRVKRYEVGTTIVDDHCASSVNVLPGRRSVVAWTDHNSNDFVYLRTTDASGDLATLGPVQSKNIGGKASYTQDHRSLAAPDSHYFLTRRWPLDSPYDWVFYKVDIDPATGAATFGTIRQLLMSTVGRQPYITSAPVTLPNGDQGIRMAITDNPGNGLNNVHYGTINLVTGAVESPGKTMTANVFTGVGLPLAFEDFDQAFTAGTGKELRTFAVRGGGSPAILCASGTNTGFATDGVFHELVRSESSAPGLHVNAATAYVSTPDHAKFHTPSLKIRVNATYATAALSKGLVRKYGSVDGQRSYQFTTISTGVLRLTTYPTGLAATTVTTDSTVAPDPAAVGLGVDFTPNNGTNRVTTFWQTLDGTTWTQVGTTVTSTTTTLFWGTAPVEIGNSTTSAIGTIRKVEFYDAAGGSTVVAGPNFASITEWTAGDGAGTTRTATAGGLPWTITGNAVIESNGWQKTDFGPTGDTVAAATPSYVSGACYPIPAQGDTKYFGRGVAGTWTIEKYTRGTGGSATTEILRSKNLKTLRPLGILNQGPFDVIASEARTYTGYNNYDADTIIV